MLLPSEKIQVTEILWSKDQKLLCHNIAAQNSPHHLGWNHRYVSILRILWEVKSTRSRVSWLKSTSAEISQHWHSTKGKTERKTKQNKQKQQQQMRKKKKIRKQKLEFSLRFWYNHYRIWEDLSTPSVISQDMLFLRNLPTAWINTGIL